MPAAAQNSTEIPKGGWSTQVTSGEGRAEPKAAPTERLPAPQYVGALPKNVTADTCAEGKT
jgi:hypothetical protein